MPFLGICLTSGREKLFSGVSVMQGSSPKPKYLAMAPPWVMAGKLRWNIAKSFCLYSPGLTCFDFCHVGIILSWNVPSLVWIIFLVCFGVFFLFAWFLLVLFCLFPVVVVLFWLFWGGFCLGWFVCLFFQMSHWTLVQPFPRMRSVETITVGPRCKSLRVVLLQLSCCVQGPEISRDWSLEESACTCCPYENLSRSDPAVNHCSLWAHAKLSRACLRSRCYRYWGPAWCRACFCLWPKELSPKYKQIVPPNLPLPHATCAWIQP